MPILTLTTDFGTKSYNIAALKGMLLSASQSINIVDITHDINNFDKLEAAFIIKNASKSFPENTIHFTNINLKEGNNRVLILKKTNQYFICPDNGIASIMFPDEDFKAYVVQGLQKTFNYRDLHSKLCEILKFAEHQKDITAFGIETNSFLRISSLRAAVNPDIIRANVIAIDKFHNAILNIDKETFYNFVGDKAFSISTRSNRAFKIHKHYTDVEPGEIVCLFNDVGLLEIAIRNGDASNLLGLHYAGLVLIETT